MKKLLTAVAVIALIAFAAPAFAANPFVDVPAGHWAYDSIEHLASRGIISGYPDGSYKGAQPMTRYEMASMVGRAVANLENAHAQDAELLKKLVLEFKNELDALGVKVTDLDKRVAVLEDGIGGWKLRGTFNFDAKFGSSDNNNYEMSNGKRNQFTKERFRLFVTKAIDENTSFYAQYRAGGANSDGMGDTSNGFWSHLYLDTKIFWGMDMRVGRFYVDFEDQYGLYTDDAALFGGERMDGFQVKKSVGIVNVTGIVGRNSSFSWDDEKGEFMNYILDLNFNLSEKVLFGATGYWSKEDSSATGARDVNTYGIYAGYDFTPSASIKGVYYFQDCGSIDSNAWKVALNMKQDLLKFTSLWVEYSKQDNSFIGNDGRYAFDKDHVGKNKPYSTDTSSWFVFVKAQQQWNDKFHTFIRYAQANFGTDGYDKATEWGVGMGYQYTPAVFFELGYDQVDHGDGTAAYTGKESVIRFRTTVNF